MLIKIAEHVSKVYIKNPATTYLSSKEFTRDDEFITSIVHIANKLKAFTYSVDLDYKLQLRLLVVFDGVMAYRLDESPIFIPSETYPDGSNPVYLYMEDKVSKKSQLKFISSHSIQCEIKDAVFEFLMSIYNE